MSSLSVFGSRAHCPVISCSEALGGPWRPLEALESPLGLCLLPLEALGGPWGTLGGPWGPFGAIIIVILLSIIITLGGHWGPFGAMSAVVVLLFFIIFGPPQSSALFIIIIYLYIYSVSFFGSSAW